MQAESCIRRQPPKRTAAGVQRADEDVIAHEQKQADEVEVTNLVSDEDDGVDMKDELDLRHEGMRGNVNMSAVLTSVNRKDDNLVTT